MSLRWVVIYGFPPERKNVLDVLRKCEDFGHVDDYLTGDGNWICVRYGIRFEYLFEIFNKNE